MTGHANDSETWGEGLSNEEMLEQWAKDAGFENSAAADAAAMAQVEAEARRDPHEAAREIRYLRGEIQRLTGALQEVARVCKLGDDPASSVARQIAEVAVLPHAQFGGAETQD